MGSKHTVDVYVTNETDGNAQIQLTHQNSSDGTQSGSWMAGPGATVGPLAVAFRTGIGYWGVLDWWSVSMTVADGSTPGNYRNTGTTLFPHEKECQLQTGDVDKTIYFTVSSTDFHTALPSGGCHDGMTRLSDYSPITNVFVLMLENRSFDHMWGQSGIPGLTVAPPGAANSYNGTSYAVASPAPTVMTADPGHEFGDVVEQLAGAGASYPSGGPYPPITMSGFASNYATATDEGTSPPAVGNIGDIMLEFNTATQLPTSYALATSFAICDHWFSSMPGPTWPNRMFVHGASSAGLDHSPKESQIAQWETVAGFTFPNGSIFDALTAKGLTWRLYNDDTDAYSDNPQNGSSLGRIPQVSALKGIHVLDVESLTQFASDLQGPYPYQYTFIEPNYGDVSSTYAGGSSQHPMDDVYGGEALIKAVYEAIRNSPLWNTSLLIVTFDEHGGFYDSVAPQALPAPADGSPSTYNEYGFTFDLSGVRVPAIVVSPLIAAGVVDSTVYDHSSVPATLERLFGVSALTARDAAANDLTSLITLPTPRTDCPTTLPAPVAAVASVEVDADSEAADAAADAEPIADGGNLPAFLATARKAAYDTYATTPREQAIVDAQYAAIVTRGDARRFIGTVMAKVALVRGSRTPR